MLNTYYFEMTDTFGDGCGGLQANYSWVKRYRTQASTERGAVWKLSRHTGYAWRNKGQGRYETVSSCIVAFVEDEPSNHYYEEI